MSEPTQALLDELRRYDAAVTTLVKVYLTKPTTRTLYLAMTGFDTPDNRTWEAAIVAFEKIRRPGSPNSPGPDLCSGGFTLATRASLGFQTARQNISHLLAQYQWEGSDVDIFLWPTRSTNIADLFRVLRARVENVSVSSDGTQIRLLQRRDWNGEDV